MKNTGFRYVYGPVLSRRLGRSLGVDLVPFKTCTYDCIYCQLGGTTCKTLERKEYVSIEQILVELKRKLSAGPVPDYISLVGSGEPTLNVRIGDLIGRIKSMTRIPVAVLTNGSLLWMSDIRQALMNADIVLPSLDAGDERLFRQVNRPCPDIDFNKMVDGIAGFTGHFSGEVWLEIFLLAGISGISSEVNKIADLARKIRPARIQLNTVYRPPFEKTALPLSKENLFRFQNDFQGRVEIISEHDHIDSKDPARVEAKDEDILALLIRHPCTIEEIAESLGIHLMDALKRLNTLTNAGKVKTVSLIGRDFYVIKG